MDPSSVAWQLARTGAAARAAATEELAAVGLHPGQEFLLAALWYREGATIGEMAVAIGVEPPTVTKMVRRLKAAGLVERRGDPDDARLTRVFLTDEGRALEHAVAAAWARLEERTSRCLDREERAQLCALLERVRGSLHGGAGTC